MYDSALTDSEPDVDDEDFILAREDSQKLAVMEALAFIIQHGWSLHRACELTGADPESVKPKINAPGQLPTLPTPEMIVSMCKEIRQINERDLPAKPPPRQPRIREYCADEWQEIPAKLI